MNLDSNNKITFNTYIDNIPSLYAYPYIIGAYKGVPEISNFDFSKDSNYITNTNSSSNTTSRTTTYSTSTNLQDTNSLSSTPLNKQSTLVVENNTNYNVNLRSLKSVSDKFNGSDIESINITQDDNYINLQQGGKPYISNFTGLEIDNNYFGKSNNNFGETLDKLTANSDDYLKSYGTILKFKYSGPLSLGNTVIYHIDENILGVKKTDSSSPVVGLVINLNTTSSFCYVCTSGICEFNGNLTANNDLIKSDNDGSISVYTNNGESIIYLVGSYIGTNSNNRHLINIQPSTLVFE